MRAYARLAADERRSQLLEIGIGFFSDRSYEAFSMDELAERAGVSKGLLYHYFPTKREFYIASLRRATAEMLELIMPPPGLPLPEQLRLGVEAYLAYVHLHAGAYRAVLRGGLGTDSEVAAIADEFRDSIYRLVVAGAGIRSPEWKLELAIRGWIGFAEAISLQWLDRQEPTAADLAGLLVETFSDVVARWRLRSAEAI